MKRDTILQLVTLAFLLWLCFFVHSCMAGHPEYTVRDIRRPPAVQVGLSSFLRVESAKIRAAGPCRIAGERSGGDAQDNRSKGDDECRRADPVLGIPHLIRDV